ncbi:MFS transporter [Flavobacteriaceae bacterium]|jgi:maltose/moltooligosaccharide transporter|uniref:MFS transporter n=1 Tax=Candidatus Arcticimaribacter forsetii TaxID=2820661 RepID=UPI00207736DD|nr:MFS transporter [Candidatus Arcticimaribacter forsetii]MCH1538839.1 MFS transporter [Flavobacteriaceae bacterium]MDA8639784.1 MFS transporter [Flavobacteriaceae bacterium]MDA8699339.1 MFS transporter [Flavobacteriaceae bacterium]MDB2325671.1 MFS transporter [Flavobacteriaceae bacterium]MDB4609008.1 MFS transporter [Flavobacteriaceae bacterium]
MIEKKQLSFWQILTMNFGFFGVQFSFGLQQSNMSAIYRYLGANEAELPMLWLAGPVTGLLVQPVIGAISDGTWSPKFGRRKPFFLIGALIASLALIAMPFSSTIWMAASLLWILDAANNIALEPYRAFVSDKLPKKQYSIGFLMQSFFTGLGSVMSNFTPAILVSFGILALSDKMDNGIPVSTYWAFGIGAIASIGTILVTVLTTSEYPPTEEELAVIKANKEKGNAFLRSLSEIKDSFIEMPKTMRQLIPVMFFSWYAMFCYWQFLTSALSLSLFDTLDQNTSFFNQAQLLTGNLNGTYNIICVLIAFPMIPIARKLGAKNLHFLSLLLGGVGLMAMPFLNDTDLLFTIPLGGGIPVSQIYLFSFGLGITWASMMAMPYQMLASSIPSDKMGVYMGIFNMFIVIPMIIQIFSMQYFVYDLLGSNPINVIRLAGACLITAGIFSLFVKVKE